MDDIALGKWRSKITPQSVVGSLESISVTHGIHIFFAHNRGHAAKLIEGLLFRFLKMKVDECSKVSAILKCQEVK